MGSKIKLSDCSSPQPYGAAEAGRQFDEEVVIKTLISICEHSEATKKPTVNENYIRNGAMKKNTDKC